jgi:site-specific DNA-methyltransferase (adenine-specific)
MTSPSTAPSTAPDPPWGTWDPGVLDAAHPAVIVHGDNLAVAATLPDASARLIYLDPPFNTGKAQILQSITTTRSTGDAPGDRRGFKGREYDTVKGTLARYDDRFDDYWAYLEPRLIEAHRLLDDRGTLYLHLDYREAHYAKVALDRLFGRDSFLNELIWAYDYGAKSTRRWPAKHDTILVYVKDPARYHFDSSAVDREPYMAPGLVTPEKAARGKLPTDVWWHTIVTTNGAERTGYPTQKPEGILRRIVQASTEPGDLVLDLFAGSGTTGAAAAALERRYLLVDESQDAVAVMRKRLSTAEVYTL